jgi:hypothetical protein
MTAFSNEVYLTIKGLVTVETRSRPVPVLSSTPTTTMTKTTATMDSTDVGLYGTLRLVKRLDPHSVVISFPIDSETISFGP